MSSGNTQSFLPQRSWQRGNSTSWEFIHATKGPRESEGVAADSRELAARGSGGTSGRMP